MNANEVDVNLSEYKEACKLLNSTKTEYGQKAALSLIAKHHGLKQFYGGKNMELVVGNVKGFSDLINIFPEVIDELFSEIKAKLNGNYISGFSTIMHPENSEGMFLFRYIATNEFVSIDGIAYAS